MRSLEGRSSALITPPSLCVGVQAAFFFAQAHKLDELQPTLLQLYGMFLHAVGDLPTALRFFDEGLSIVRMDESCSFMGAVCLQAMGQFNAAVERYGHVTRLTSSYHPAHITATAYPHATRYSLHSADKISHYCVAVWLSAQVWAVV